MSSRSGRAPAPERGLAVALDDPRRPLAELVITSTIAAPLLPALGLDGGLGAVPIGQVLAVMAIGAGSMVVSHVDDSYSWVVSQFSGMSVTTAYRAHTAATLVQGLTGIGVTAVLGAVLV